MINKLFFGLVIFLMIASCKKDDCTPAQVNANFILKKDIEVIYNSDLGRYLYSITEGNKLLFVFSQTEAQCEGVADDEKGENLSFVVADSVSEFEFRDEAILETNCFYQQFGAWVRHNQYQVNSGLIKGQKISENEWSVVVSVKTKPIFDNEQPELIEFAEIFRLE